MSTPPAAPLPDRIGGYRIVRKIGEGGMGVVFEAEQQHPRRPVALKVIRGGRTIDDHHVRLFQREAQTLARLKHPGIAAIYESGRTEDGQHFFAMELVRGETLSEHLRRRDGTLPSSATAAVENGAGGAQPPAGAARSTPRAPLPPAEIRYRLRLVQRLCEAVGYAHQRGVIHRDLKPGNVLVARDSTATSPSGAASHVSRGAEIKILDFGLARITDTDVQMSTVLTDVGVVQGTIPYMSPEQIRGNTDEIDLRTDVYSLGVLLHEALSGRHPLAVQRLSLPEAARVICEQAPEPLTRSVPAGQKVDADLATIVAKALEKEPARRYQSAVALGEDLERYLTDQPILARPPSAAYQLRKLVSRHRVAFAAVVAALVMLAGFAVTMAVQAQRIARERDRASREAETAKQVSEFLVGLFEVSDPFEARGNTITAREILDKGAEKIERELKGQPLVQARLMDTMGNVYHRLSILDRAEPLLRSALRTREALLGPMAPEVGESLTSLCSALHARGEFREAVALCRRAVSIQEVVFGPSDLQVGWPLYRLVSALAFSSDPDEGQRLLERAMAIFERTLGPDHWAVAWCLNDIAFALHAAERNSEATPLLERALEIKKARLGPDHPDVAVALNAIGFNLVLVGDYDRAKQILEQALAMHERIFPPDHLYTALCLHSLGELMRRMGRLAEAAPLLERALAAQEKALSPEHPDFALTLDSLARVRVARGETGAAEGLFRRALLARERSLSPGDPLIADTLEGLAGLLSGSGHAAEAKPLEERARAIRTRRSSARTVPGEGVAAP